MCMISVLPDSWLPPCTGRAAQPGTPTAYGSGPGACECPSRGDARVVCAGVFVLLSRSVADPFQHGLKMHISGGRVQHPANSNQTATRPGVVVEAARGNGQFQRSLFALLFWKVLETGHETVELCLFDQPPVRPCLASPSLTWY